MDIDARIAAVRQRIGAAGTNPFVNLLKTIELRQEFEAISKHLLIDASAARPSFSSLKLLEVLELARATDVARKIERVAPIAQPERPRWSRRRPAFGVQHTPGAGGIKLRQIHQTSIREAVKRRSQPGGTWVELDHLNSERDKAVRLDLSKTLILHLGCVGDSLVLALDANLNSFVYGKSARDEDPRLQGSSFSDYGYDAASLDYKKLIYGPVVKPRARRKSLKLVEESQANFAVQNRAAHCRFFRKLAKRMDRIFNFDQIKSSIERWAREHSYGIDDVCLVVIPDEHLYLLPFSFLGASRGTPLITWLGGVVNALSLLTFKWALKDYHWTTFPNQSKKDPRCSVFAASNPPGLQLAEEIVAITQGFGEDLTQCFGPDATLAEFGQHYSSGEVCWFTGHGMFDDRQGIDVGGRVIPMPLSGPAFGDGVLTNLELIASSNWNFKPLWLTVMNSCLLARSLLVGPNPLGFMSALHSAGSISTAAALWPIWDDSSVKFAGHFSRELRSHYRTDLYPRAAALGKAIRRCLKNGLELSDVAAYSLWGIP